MVLYFIQKHKKLPHNHTIHTETVQSDNMDRPAASRPLVTQRHRSIVSPGAVVGRSHTLCRLPPPGAKHSLFTELSRT